MKQLHTHVHTLFSAHARTHSVVFRCWQVSHVVYFTRVHVTRDICLQVGRVSHPRLRGARDRRSHRQLTESKDPRVSWTVLFHSSIFSQPGNYPVWRGIWCSNHRRQHFVTVSTKFVSSSDLDIVTFLLFIFVPLNSLFSKTCLVKCLQIKHLLTVDGCVVSPNVLLSNVILLATTYLFNNILLSFILIIINR